MGIFDRIKNVIAVRDDEASKQLEELEKQKAELETEIKELEAELEALDKENEAAPVPDSSEPEDGKSFFDQSDFDAIRAAQTAESAAKAAEERRTAEATRIIKDALSRAFSIYIDALKEIPKYAKASGIDHVQFYTGFNTGFHPAQSRNSRGNTYFYYADTDGKIEKRWGADIHDSDMPVKECSLEQFQREFQKLIDDAEIKTPLYVNNPVYYNIYDKKPFDCGPALFTLEVFTFQGMSYKETLCYSYRFKNPDLVECIRSKDEMKATIREQLLWCLSGKNIYEWHPADSK